MGTCEIKLRIHDEAELYNPFDEDRQVLSDEVLSYIMGRFDEKRLGEAAAIRIVSDGEIDRENVTEAFRGLIQSRLSINAKERKKNSAKMLRLFIIGLAFVTAGIVLGVKLDAVPTEILSIIGSFAVWEAANIWIVENPQTRMERRLLTRLAESEIRFDTRT